MAVSAKMAHGRGEQSKTFVLNRLRMANHNRKKIEPKFASWPFR